jgi:hypothetical protein
MARALDGLWLALVVAWVLLVAVAEGVPHRPRSAAALECVATVKEFARQYARSGCAKVLPYRLDVNELMADCVRGDDEDLRVVISKIKHVGEQAFAGPGACLPWLDDSDGVLLLPPPSSSPPPPLMRLAKQAFGSSHSSDHRPDGRALL